MKILVCDDSMTIRKKLSKTLQNILPCEVIEARDGEESINLFTKHSPDLVFMDILMPHKDGLAAVEEIIKINEGAKIIMLSSIGTKENLQKALKYAALDFIQKPFEEERLKQIFRVHFGKEL